MSSRTPDTINLILTNKMMAIALILQELEDHVESHSRIARDRRRRKQTKRVEQLNQLLQLSRLRAWQIDERIERISLIKIT